MSAKRVRVLIADDHGTMSEGMKLLITRQPDMGCPQVRVLALTRLADYGLLTEMLRAGAKGYVLKQSSSADLILAVRAVAFPVPGAYLPLMH